MERVAHKRSEFWLRHCDLGALQPHLCEASVFSLLAVYAISAVFSTGTVAVVEECQPSRVPNHSLEDPTTFGDELLGRGEN